MVKPKNCIKCGIKFLPENGKKKVCCQCRWVPLERSCHNCGEPFIAKASASIHCSRKCITTTRNKKWTVGGDAWREKWGENADAKMEEFRKKISAVTAGEKNPMHGRNDQIQTLVNRNRARLGVTNSQFYGEKKAAEISRKISSATAGEKNPAYGKVYARGGRSVKGYYKGKFFRSLLEYSFMKHLESTGFSLDDIDYECFIVPWVNEEGTNRTYRPDFYNPASKTVYEVKQSYALSSCNLKHEAAQSYFDDRGLTFKVVTENDFLKIKFEDALKDENIEWDERTFSYFDKSKR
jgi:hypothetical protein